MCGIAGIFNYEGGGIPVKVLKNMTDSLAHRGPDDRGIYSDDSIGLGHRRLSIIDLEGGRQPMADDTGRFHITFNGEIYNYHELRKTLEKSGHRFRTRSDTEVLLHACIEWGHRAPEKINGMFGFGFWDRKERSLFLARDRSGVKPLYYKNIKKGFLFASEIKAILQYPGIKVEPNLETIAFYLSHYQTVMGDETLFKGIHNLEPGCTLTVEPDKITRRRYWMLPVVPEESKEDKGEEYYIDGVKHYVEQSLKRRMISDVPLGAYLSGGIDSSILVGLMSENTGIPVRTFAIGFDEKGFNEFEYSDMVAAAWGTNHTQIVIGEDDYFAALDDVIMYKDGPLSVPNEVPLYLMSGVLKEDISVVLSGEGSDELFGGYGVILRSPIDYLRSLPDSSVPKNQRKLLNKALMRLYGRTEFKDEMDHFLAVYSWMKPNELHQIFDKSLANNIQNFPSINNYWLNHFSKVKDLDIYNKYLYLMETVHLPGLLARLDNTTMAASVEGRVPFTDPELLNFVSDIPFKYKLRWNSPMYETMCARLNSYEIAETLDTTKYILKRSFVDKVPPDVLFRKKYSFPVPLIHWFGKQLLSQLLSMMETSLPSFLDRQGIIDWLGNSADSDKPLKAWMLLNLLMWYEKYFKQTGSKISEMKMAAIG